MYDLNSHSKFSISILWYLKDLSVFQFSMFNFDWALVHLSNLESSLDKLSSSGETMSWNWYLRHPFAMQVILYNY